MKVIVKTVWRPAVRGTAACLNLLLLSLMILGCQLGTGAQPAPTPQPPATPLPPAPPTANTPTPFERKLQMAPRKMELTKVIDGYLYVRHLPPCELVPSPAEWVAPIILTDLRSRSVVSLNSDGTVKSTDYRSDEGKVTLEAALKESAVIEQIVARPECPEIFRQANVGEPGFCGGLYGWPDHEKENIGEPPMPKVGLSNEDPTRGTCMGNGWIGSYCWPTSTGGHTCEDREGWSELEEAETYGLFKGPRKAHITVLGDEANAGRVSRIRMLTLLGEGSLGDESYSLDAPEGETIVQFAKPDILEGVYLLISSYESPLGEVEYGFKVELFE